MNNYIKITIGIPTYYGGPSLVKTVKSILKSQGVDPFKIIVTVDGNPLDENIFNELKLLKVEVLNNQDRLGQVGRINQLIKNCKTEFIILTQDDVLFEQDTLKKIIKILNNKQTTMVGAKVIPPTPKTFLEKVLKVGVNLTYRIGTAWNNGDNYLLASGRCLGFQTEFIQKFIIPKKVINSDAYLYFENKRNNGKFSFAADAIVYIKSPQTLKEHIKQSNKFIFSKQEMISLKIKNIEPIKEYSLPKNIIIRSYLYEFLTNPLFCFIYFAVFLYTRTFQIDTQQYKTGIWKTDTSTKHI